MINDFKIHVKYSLKLLFIHFYAQILNYLYYRPIINVDLKFLFIWNINSNQY